jgi:hypothetical protein
MKITNIKTHALFGETPMTGWTSEPGPASAVSSPAKP